MKAKRHSAAGLIAFHFGWDVSEVTETRYQPSVYANPAVFVIGDDYYAAPSNNRSPRHSLGKPWHEVAEYYGRVIYCSEMETVS